MCTKHRASVPKVYIDFSIGQRADIHNHLMSLLRAKSNTSFNCHSMLATRRAEENMSPGKNATVIEVTGRRRVDE